SEGWREYEWRWRLAASPPRRLPAPAWQGEAGEGRTLLLHAEQGLGDTLQFIRYLPLAAARGFRVVAEVQEPLVRLVAASFPEAAVIPRDTAALPPFDLHAPLMSLPALFNTTLETVPAAIPYLRPPADMAARPVPGNGLRIGISWGGDPRHNNDSRRSIPLKRLLPALNGADVSLFSLQKGPKADELAGVEGVTDLGAGFDDLADTAAALAGLDLVISVDTAIAHLAGALGRPVWILLPFAPDWRWLLGVEASPWYPTARLFRQPAPGAWDAVLSQLSASLSTLPRP
ncbi:MAG: hypothetical protein K2Q10_13475, partial [Rhodospirillales bacterium]|nr:hypothetical protein [Rhodospirillales bacterium]